MKTEQVSKQIITAILLTLDDNFRKKFKMPLKYEEKILISSQDIMSSKQYHIDKLMKKKSIQALGDSSKVFDDLLKQSIVNHPIYTIVSKVNRFKQNVLFVKRKCIYVDQHNIVSIRNLIHYIYLHHHGTLIDEQFLNFTYVGVDTDIESGVNDKIFIRMPMVVRNIEQFALFPNLEENIFEVPNVEGLHFQEEYLDLCKQFLNHQQRVYEEEENSYIQIQINNRDPNYKLPGFRQMKMQWKIKQAMNEISTKEQDRRKEKEEMSKGPNRKNKHMG